MTRFVDQASISVLAGCGGKGCRSFYQDLWNRYPIPDGGDGGRGGQVLVQANPQLTTLLDFQTQRHFRAGSGGNASSKRKHGARGTDCVIRVPLGTLVYDADSGDLIREILFPGDEVVVARGGAGGVGNGSRSSLQKTRSEEMPLDGSGGEKRRLRLELKLVADVAIVGLPNAGKSTLLSHISQARPKVASYPFTTINPILGAVRLPSDFRIVAVDVPGLMEGAHRGKGLGLGFLRHIERTKVLIHLVDMAAVDGRDPAADYKTLNAELKAYQSAVAKKPQILVANKMDLPAATKNLVRFRRLVKVDLMPISAENGDGIPKLLKAVAGKLKRFKPEHE